MKPNAVIPHTLRIEDAVEVVAFVLDDARVETRHGSVDRRARVGRDRE